MTFIDVPELAAALTKAAEFRVLTSAEPVRRATTIASSCQTAIMNPDYCLDVPAGFDDSDEDAQVHPMARRLFYARTPAEVFGKAQQWVGENNVFLVDVSWNWAHDEPEPFTLAVYFTFEDDADGS